MVEQAKAKLEEMRQEAARARVIAGSGQYWRLTRVIDLASALLEHSFEHSHHCAFATPMQCSDELYPCDCGLSKRLVAIERFVKGAE